MVEDGEANDDIDAIAMSFCAHTLILTQVGEGMSIVASTVFILAMSPISFGPPGSDELSTHDITVNFVTMLVGTGGNAGNQSGVIVTRALSHEREFLHANYCRILGQEAQLALVQGCVLALVTFGRVLVEFPDYVWPALTIATALFVVVFFSMQLAVAFSLGIDRLGLDPAAGSAPLLTVVADMLGISTLCLVGLAILGSVRRAPSYCDPEKLEKCPAALLMQSVVANLTSADPDPSSLVLSFPPDRFFP